MSSNATRSSRHRILVFVSCAALAVTLSNCGEPPTEPTDRQAPEAAAPAAVVPPAPFTGCEDGTQASGAFYQLCFPAPGTWNGNLVVWGHGYRSPLDPVEIPDDRVGGTPVRDIILGLGYAYGTSSYVRNGLVAVDASRDLLEIPEILLNVYGVEPLHTVVVGGSEGALAATLAVEQAATKFDGGMLNCGPIGNFREQINHFGNFRAVFDYFFPGVMPGSAIEIPSVTLDVWDQTEQDIRDAVHANPHATEQLLRVTRVPVDPVDPAETITGLLWYSFFATNDARDVLGGNPFDNRYRIYTGSDNDWRLNLRIRRYRADATALAALQAYETTGRLRVPAVVMHTTGDPIVPYWHAARYKWKTWKAGTRLMLNSFPVNRYGHCEFEVSEVVAGFAVLMLRVTLRDLIATAEVFPSVEQQQDFLRLARQNGARPVIADRLPDY